MKTTPSYDLKLSQDLSDILDKLRSMRDDLRSRHSGCCCDEHELCAHHAQIHNDLTTAVDDLTRTIKDTNREY
ncbi:MAG: hypothetical protein WCK35_19165 [Chloroflexota bacterium]